MIIFFRLGVVLALSFVVSEAVFAAEEEKAPSDKFAGKTVKDKHMGRALIKARSKLVPKLGQVAPDFELQVMGEEKKIKLSSYKGKMPVVLVFGSYT